MTRYSALIAAFVGAWLVAGLASGLRHEPAKEVSTPPADSLSKPEVFEDWLAGVALRTRGDHKALSKEEADRLVAAKGINALHSLRAKWLQVKGSR